MPPSLQIMSGEQAGTAIELAGPTVRLGRHPECEVLLDLNSVSRYHAQLLKDGDGYLIEDLGSRNGTFVNGQRIEERTRLKDNDRIKICDMLLAYRDTNTATETGPAPEPPEDESTATILRTLDAKRTELHLQVKPQAKLQAILEISQALANSLDQGAIFPRMLDCLFKIFPQADRSILILDDHDVLRIRAVKLRRPSDETVRFSHTLARQAMRERTAILSADASSDERWSMSQSLADFRIRSVMCVPLLTQAHEPLGVLQVDTQSYHQKFEEEDLQILLSVASQASIAIENARMHEAIVAGARIERELAFAKEVQAGFLPKETPRVAGYQFWSYYEAAGSVGGDYFDFVCLPAGRIAAIVADVSGKGVPAALLMAKASSDTKVALMSSPEDVAGAAERINQAVISAQLEDRFITMALCVLDPATHELAMVSAGHMSPLVRRAGGSIEEPTRGTIGLPIGVLDTPNYQAVRVTLEPGDAVLLYSDGISEAMNARNELYGFDRLRQSFAAQTVAAPRLGEALLWDVRAHAAGHPQNDDITMVVFSRSAS